MNYRIAALAAVFVASPLAAQDAAPIAQQAPVTMIAPAPIPAPAAMVPGQQILPPGANAMLQSGTPLSLTLLHEVTTKGKNLRVGDRIRLEVAEPVLVNGVAVVPQGAPVSGEVTEVRNKGMWGRSGRFVVRLLNVTANGRQIRLGGTFDDKGKAGGWGAAAVSAVVFLPAGFFMTGTSALLPAGTTVQAFIDEDVPLALPASATAPAVLSVPAAVEANAPPPAPEPAPQVIPVAVGG